MSPDQLDAAVDRQVRLRLEQGLPEVVSDPAVLATIAAQLRAHEVERKRVDARGAA